MRLPAHNAYYEYFGNIHMHTTHSDGVGAFADVVNAARQARVDFIYVTDHNILVREQEEGYRDGLLTLVGQEVHDDERVPQRNHLLCLGVATDMTPHARQPQGLIDTVTRHRALSFLAHPFEEVTYYTPQHWSWENWEVTGYTGVELWNYMSSFRGFTTSRPRALLMGYYPHWFTRGPLPVMLHKWDVLTQERAVVAIGGTDVHGLTYNIGPFQRVFLPYLHCALALNTHILTEEPFLGATSDADHRAEAVQHDHALVLAALQAGHCWTGYDLVGSSKGFRFCAWQGPAEQSVDSHGRPHAIMGDTLAAPRNGHVTHFHVNTPAAAEICLLHNGRVIKRQQGRALDFASGEPGVYRVEVWRRRWGKPRGWIFSNPIYVR